jgi:hypothetical protein
VPAEAPIIPHASKKYRLVIWECYDSRRNNVENTPARQFPGVENRVKTERVEEKRNLKKKKKKPPEALSYIYIYVELDPVGY